MIRREAEAVAHKRRFLLCRVLLTLLTCAIGILQADTSYAMGIVVLLGLELISTAYMGMLDPLTFYDPTTESTVLLVDEVMVFTVLLVAGVGRELLVAFFFVIILAAVIEDLAALSAAAAVIGLATMIYGGLEHGGVSPSVVLRLPFVVMTGLFYGYVVAPEREAEQARREEESRKQAAEAESSV